MENEHRNDDARRDYEAPELTVLASVAEATLGAIETINSDGTLMASVAG
jgi:hypothetical protein